MISSTPQNTLKKAKPTNKTPLRRSLFGLPKTPVVLEKKNDELERSHRRSMVHLQKRMSFKTANQAPDSPNPQVEEKELKMHFDICLKMFSENKINAKNVWSLKIIDYLKQIVQTNTISRDSLQVGSVSLDVGAKVYGIRVDDVHAEGLKLASTMSRIGSRKEDAGEGDDDGGEVGEDNENENNKQPEKKKRKRRMCKKNTLSTNIESLFGPIPKIKGGAFQTNTNSDLSAIDNYFTNSVPTDCTQSKWILSEQVTAYEFYDNEDPSLKLDKAPIKLTNINNNLDLCSDFSTFEVDNWDPETDDVKFQDSSINDNVLVYDNAGDPVPELDGSVHDLFADAGDVSSADEEEEEIAQLGMPEVANICDALSGDEDSNYSNDYLYSSFANPLKSITNLWAGPSHWKMKHVRRTQSRYSGVTTTDNVPQQPPRKRVKVTRNDTRIDFSHDSSGEEITGTNKKFIKAPMDDKFLLPSNFCIEDEYFLKLSGKDGYLNLKENKMKETLDEENDMKAAPINDENHNNSMYSADHHDDDDFDNGAQNSFNGEMEIAIENQDGNEQQFVGKNLIDMPELVPKSQIHFATKAKKMDMKKLKLATWKILVNEMNSNDIITPNLFENEVQKTDFYDLYKILPNLLNASMKEELSPHLAFVALLHLANEHSLKLDRAPDLVHFTIEKDKRH